MQTSSSSAANPASTHNSTHKWFLFLVVVSLVTMVTHFYLTNQHYDLKLGSASGPSICNISSTFNCDSVAASRYADLAGIPVALLGLITQVLFFILLISARFELSGHPALLKHMLFWFSAFTLLMSIVMGSISGFLLGTYCLFCMTAYGLSILQMLGAWKIQDSPPGAHLGEDLGHLFKESKWVLVLVILIPALSWMINSMMLKSAGMDKIEMVIQDSLAEWEAGATQSFQPDRGLVQGKVDSEPIMKIVEFADFLCPHCKLASTPLEAFTQAHSDVQLNFKVFTLDGTCNKAVPSRGNGLRCKLGASVFCAEKLSNKGWPAHHWIFERQDDFHQATDAKPIVEKMSHDLGLDAEKIQTCMNEDSTQESLEAMAQEGAAAHIQGTPTVFVNGKILPRGQFLPVLEGLYQKLKK